MGKKTYIYMMTHAVLVLWMMGACERGPRQRMMVEQEQDTAHVQTAAAPAEERTVEPRADASRISDRAGQYALLLNRMSGGNLQIERLAAGDVSNMPYELLMPLRDQIYQLQQRTDTAAERERIARVLLHCTNMALYHRTELLSMLADSLRTQGKLAEAAQAYNAVIEHRLQDGPGATDGDAMRACLVLQSIYGEAGSGREQMHYARMGYEIAQRHEEYPHTRDAPALVYAQALLLNGDAETARRVLSDTAWVSEESRQCAVQIMKDIPAFVQRQQEQARLKRMTEERVQQLPAGQRKQVEEEVQRLKKHHRNQ